MLGRKLFVSALSMALMLVFVTGPSFAYIQGDIDGDNEVTIGDAVLVMKCLARMKVTGTIQKGAGVIIMQETYNILAFVHMTSMVL
jgi:hypothetical protein